MVRINFFSGTLEINWKAYSNLKVFIQEKWSSLGKNTEFVAFLNRLFSPHSSVLWWRKNQQSLIMVRKPAAAAATGGEQKGLELLQNSIPRKTVTIWPVRGFMEDSTHMDFLFNLTWHSPSEKSLFPGAFCQK